MAKRTMIGLEYVASYKDLTNAKVDGFQHYVDHGLSEGRNTKIETSQPPVPPPVIPPVNPPTEPYYTVDNGEVKVTIAKHFGGAIASLMFLQEEFVNRVDPGRLIQTAVSFNNLGEALNPTQGGNVVDDDSGVSATLLQSVSVEGLVITTQAQLAYWLPVDGVVLSDVILIEQITVGIPLSKRIVKIVPNLYIPKAQGSGLFEILTGYLLDKFKIWQTFDPVTAALSAPLVGGPRNENVPLIVSSDPQHAMGIYTPSFTGIDGKGSGYCWFPASYLGSPVEKWSLWFMRANTPAGNYDGECYLIIGSVDEVKNLMIELHWLDYSIPGPPPVIPPVLPPVEPPVEPPVIPPVEPPIEPPVYVAPPDWEDAVYLFLLPEVAAHPVYGKNPLAHWFEWGEKEKRIWKPEGWSSAQYLKNYPEDAVALAAIGPLLHWWKFGRFEGRNYYKPGLEIMEFKRLTECDLPIEEYFFALKVKGIMTFGSYNLTNGKNAAGLYQYPRELIHRFTNTESAFDGIEYKGHYYCSTEGDRAHGVKGKVYCIDDMPPRCVFTHPRWDLLLNLHVHTDGWLYVSGWNYSDVKDPGGVWKTFDGEHWEKYFENVSGYRHMAMCSHNEELWTASTSSGAWMGKNNCQPAVFRGSTMVWRDTGNKNQDGFWGIESFRNDIFLGRTNHAAVVRFSDKKVVLDCPGHNAIFGFLVDPPTQTLLVFVCSQSGAGGGSINTGADVYATKTGNSGEWKKIPGTEDCAAFEAAPYFDPETQEVWIPGGKFNQGGSGWGRIYKSVRGSI